MHDTQKLVELRERRRQTQVQMAQTLGTSQANVSKLERRNDLYLSTLSDYVEALGGRLELRAVFPDEVIQIDVGGNSHDEGIGSNGGHRDRDSHTDERGDTPMGTLRDTYGTETAPWTLQELRNQ
ncbi:MAG: hypothetical protein ACRDF8_04820 [Chloroflexota bacterium]